MNQNHRLPPAMLLLGPTGAGKSPLGDQLARRWGWMHFDFGVHLRRIGQGHGSEDIDPEDRTFIASLLAANRLFPDEAFPLVRRIFQTALSGLVDGAGVVLNGLPRTEFQAREIAPLIAMRAVVQLNCSAEVVASRVERRRQGLTSDHGHRSDDSPEEVQRKLEIFRRRTRPLIEFYRSRALPVVTVDVAVDTDEIALADLVSARLSELESDGGVSI